MRKALMLGAASVALIGFPAYADVDVTAHIDKTKDIKVVERIWITKYVNAVGRVRIDPDKFTESHALVNQDNNHNTASENCAEKRDTIIGSVNNNNGFVSVNQAAGNMNNQANAVSAAIDADVPVVGPSTGFADAQASVEQDNTFNKIDTVNILFRDAVITNSINNDTGVIHVNQSSGNMANQSNTLSLALSLRDTGVALAESDLGQFNTSNTVLESRSSGSSVGITKSASITGSITNNAGVIGVNQSSGNMANQANVVSFAGVGRF